VNNNIMWTPIGKNGGWEARIRGGLRLEYNLYVTFLVDEWAAYLNGQLVEPLPGTRKPNTREEAMALAEAVLLRELWVTIDQAFPHGYTMYLGETVKGGVPKHLARAVVLATRAFDEDDIGSLATINEYIQPFAEAAIRWGRRLADKARGGR
jgi:hypothetical protein